MLHWIVYLLTASPLLGLVIGGVAAARYDFSSPYSAATVAGGFLLGSLILFTFVSDTKNQLAHRLTMALADGPMSQGPAQFDRVAGSDGGATRAQTDNVLSTLARFAKEINFEGDPNIIPPSSSQAVTAMKDFDLSVSIVVEDLISRINLEAAENLLDDLKKQFSPGEIRQTLKDNGWTIEQAASMARLLQYRILAEEPIQTDPHFSYYEWAGKTLQNMHGITDDDLEKEGRAGPPAEKWAFFSDRVGMGPASISGTAVKVGDIELGPITMRDLVKRVPQVLGADGVDPDNDRQKYFFVKQLDPSDFPEFALVGFNPATVSQLKGEMEEKMNRRFTDAQFETEFRRYTADLYWEDRQHSEEVSRLVRSNLKTQADFQVFKAAYKSWAIDQAKKNWMGDEVFDVAPFVDSGSIPNLETILRKQTGVRREIVSYMHRIDYKDADAILIESPTVHGIAGLSIQSHPKHEDNFYPKDELWIHKPVYGDKGKRIGWVLIEPQRTFDKTDSSADFFTPFAWDDETNSLGFRKNITEDQLLAFVDQMDATPKPREHYIRRSSRNDSRGSPATIAGDWYDVVDEHETWPYFRVWQFQVSEEQPSDPAITAIPLEHNSFAEIHVTRGEFEVILKGIGVDKKSLTITPTQPLLLPASLPYDKILIKSKGPAELLYFTRRPTDQEAVEEEPAVSALGNQLKGQTEESFGKLTGSNAASVETPAAAMIFPPVEPLNVSKIMGAVRERQANVQQGAKADAALSRLLSDITSGEPVEIVGFGSKVRDHFVKLGVKFAQTSAAVSNENKTADDAAAVLAQFEISVGEFENAAVERNAREQPEQKIDFSATSALRAFQLGVMKKTSELKLGAPVALPGAGQPIVFHVSQEDLADEHRREVLVASFAVQVQLARNLQTDESTGQRGARIAIVSQDSVNEEDVLNAHNQSHGHELDTTGIVFKTLETIGPVIDHEILLTQLQAAFGDRQIRHFVAFTTNPSVWKTSDLFTLVPLTNASAAIEAQIETLQVIRIQA